MKPIPMAMLAVCLAALAIAAEPAKPEAPKPKPLDQKAIAEGAVLQSKMHAAQRNNLAVEADIQRQAAELPQVRSSRERLKATQDAYNAWLAKARKEAGAADACEPDLDMKWVCPPPAAAKPEPKEAAKP